jgi:hypothetical protein
MATTNGTDDEWSKAVTLLTGLVMPDRAGLFTDIHGNDSIPLMNVRIEQRTDTSGSDIQYPWGQNTFGHNYTFLYLRPNGHTVDAWYIYVDYLWDYYGAYPNDSTGYDLDTYRNAPWHALTALTTAPYSSRGVQYGSSRNSGSVPDSAAVDLGELAALSHSLDRTATFLQQHRDTLKTWLDEMDQPDASWKGNAAQRFTEVLTTLKGDYTDFRLRLAPTDDYRGTSTFGDDQDTRAHTKQGDALIRIEQTVRDHAVKLLTALNTWQQDYRSHPNVALDRDILAKLVEWINTNQISQVKEVAQTASGDPAPGSGSDNSTKTLQVTGNLVADSPYGDLSQLSTWVAIGTKAVQNWQDYADTALGRIGTDTDSVSLKAITEVSTALFDASDAFTGTFTSTNPDSDPDDPFGSGNDNDNDLDNLLNHLGLGNTSGNGPDVSDLPQGGPDPGLDTGLDPGTDTGLDTGNLDLAGLPPGSTGTDPGLDTGLDPGLDTGLDTGSSDLSLGPDGSTGPAPTVSPLTLGTVSTGDDGPGGLGPLTTGPGGSKTTTNPDGSITTTNPDGSSVTDYPDGSQKFTAPDGTVTRIAADGTETVTGPDGTVTTTLPNGATTVTGPDGAVSSLGNDGTLTTLHPGGAVTTTLPDGTTRTVQPDGSITTARPLRAGTLGTGSSTLGGLPAEESGYDPSTDLGGLGAGSALLGGASGAAAGEGGAGMPMGGMGGGAAGGQEGSRDRVREVIGGETGTGAPTRLRRRPPGEDWDPLAPPRRMATASGDIGPIGPESDTPRTESRDVPVLAVEEPAFDEQEDVWGAEEGGSPAVIGR